MTCHDYTQRYWGHDFTFRPLDSGQQGQMSGWGKDIHVGDTLLLPNGHENTRYRIEQIRYELDPPDMWHARVSFYPRTQEEKEQDGK